MSKSQIEDRKSIYVPIDQYPPCSRYLEECLVDSQILMPEMPETSARTDQSPYMVTDTVVRLSGSGLKNLQSQFFSNKLQVA